MYIAPNSTIILLHNCPLDKTYDHTLTFASALAQQNYFKSLAKYTFNDQSYTRYQRGVLTIQRKAEDLYDCNYLMFQNTSFGNKWFYAFVTAIDYVNNVTSRVSFEIDVMQTWKFDYTLGQCFVEREHPLTDNIGDNLVPEKLELGEYICDGFSKCQSGHDTGLTASMLDPLTLMFACTFDENFADYHGGFYSGVYSGLYFKHFDIPQELTASAINDLVSAIDTWLQAAVGAGKPQGIVCAFVMPTCLVTSDHTGHPPRQNQFHKYKNYANIDGYVPKNKKLFTYPYNFLYVTNYQGQSVAYPYEYFNDPDNPNECHFFLTGDVSPNPSVVLVPDDYKTNGHPNWDEKLVLTGYPQLPFSTDVFKAWLANGANGTMVNAISTVAKYASAGAVTGAVAGAGVGAVPGAGVGTAIGIASAVFGTLATAVDKAIQPPQAHSGAGSTSMVTAHMLDFGFTHKHIRREFAEIIDNYFNMFGYATHRVKVPNRTSRPHWNYVKTVGCVAVGSVPADDMSKIMSIYDRGITFWKNGNEVGNYSLDNSPI